MTSGGETVHHNTDVPAPTVASVEIDDSHLIRPVLHHVTFKTTRLQEMIDWYRQVVGAEPKFQFEGGAGPATTRRITGSLSSRCLASRMTTRR